MKKFYILIFNIFIVILIFFVFDFLYFDNEFYTLHNKNPRFDIKNYWNFITRDLSEQNFYDLIINNKNKYFHEIQNKNSNKNPIILFGCSFAYGHKIPVNKTLHKILAKYTQRPIYDFSLHGWGTNHMLYQLSNESFYKKINKEPEYIIYVYIEDHLNRIYNPVIITIPEYYGAYYKNIKGNLKLKKSNNIITRFPLLSYLKKIFNEKQKNYEDNSIDFFLQHMNLSMKYAKKHWKNTKFVVFMYESFLPDYKLDKIKQKLKQRGFIVIDKNDFTEIKNNYKNYWLNEEDSHPNEKAWEAIVPYLKKSIKDL